MSKTLDELFTAVSEDLSLRTRAPGGHEVIAASRRRSTAVAVASAAAVLVGVLVISVVSLTLLSGTPSRVEPAPSIPPPGLDAGEVPVWYDDAGLHYGDAVDQTAVPLTLRGAGAALSLVRTGALYQDPKLREVWFHPWGGEPRVVGKDSASWPSYGPAGDPEGDTAAWFEDTELVVYDTVEAEEIARVSTARDSGKRAPEHFQNGNGFMQVSSDAVVWSSTDTVLTLDLQTEEITQTEWNWATRLEDIHGETELWTVGSGLSVRTPSNELKFPTFEARAGRLSPDGSFLLAVTTDPHGTEFVDLESGESFTLPDEDGEFYPWISWSYGSTALIIADGDNAATRTWFGGALLSCDAEGRECERLPTSGKVILPAT